MTAGTTMTTIGLALALLATPNHAFTSVRPHGPNNANRSMQRKAGTERAISRRTTTTTTISTTKNVALSAARDTIFSLGDDNDNDNDNDNEPHDFGSIDISDLIAASNETGGSTSGESGTKKRIGDPLREDNGIRPSIHPTTINAIVDALKARATQSIKKPVNVKNNNDNDNDDDDDDDVMHFRTTDTVEPLMVMLTAGQFASDAIQKRQESSEADGMLMTQGEEQTVAGRIMGVIMRFDVLEAELAERVSRVEWIGQYDEWGNFGVLSDEHETNLAREEEKMKSGDGDDDDDDDDGLATVHAKILEDPLFCMNRAECLLAIFLQEVEIPQLQKLGETVPDGSKIDFLDQDRMEVVVGME